MVQETKPLAFYTMVLGNTLNIHQEFLKRLRQRVHLTEVYDANNCDVIFAFFSIVSRAGTDIEAALQKIPDMYRPVVLVGLHFTFDENYMAPNSSSNINRNNVFAVDVLCYEDLGLLRCCRNDEALKAVTDHLISVGGLPNTQLETARPCSRSMFICICIIFVIAVAIAIAFSVYGSKWKNSITPTVPPIITTTLPPTITTTLPPNNTTTLPPNNTTTLPPNNTTTLPPNNTTTLPPNNTTTLPPNITTTLPPNITKVYKLPAKNAV